MISIIAAVAKNNAIGKDNKLLWHLPEDLKRFKEITLGHTIIMGRKTFESLPKILPGRNHIVITRNKAFKVENKRVTVVNSIEEAMELLKEEGEYFVIGGEKIYKQFLPFADKMYITFIEEEFHGDVFFPDIDYTVWRIVESIACTESNKNTLSYRFTTLERINGNAF